MSTLAYRASWQPEIGRLLMRFAGHQTFPIRDGWLYKGLRMMVETPEHFGADDVAERLGVGRNMAKAIHHWLLGTGLAAKDASHGARTRILAPTDFGRRVWAHDRYFLLPGTWWAIHIRLVLSRAYAYTWHWFFNRFSSMRFEKPVCVEALSRHLAITGGRKPALNTLTRDVACLLNSYATRIPPAPGDPEDALECPLRELWLLTYSAATGFYRVNRDEKEVAPEVFGFGLAAAREVNKERTENGAYDYSINELSHGLNSAGHLFCLTSEALYSLLSKYESTGQIRIDGGAGERIVKIEGGTSDTWMERYYASPECRRILAA